LRSEILFIAFRVFDHPNARTELCSWGRATPRYRIVDRRADNGPAPSSPRRFPPPCSDDLGELVGFLRLTVSAWRILVDEVFQVIEVVDTGVNYGMGPQKAAHGRIKRPGNVAAIAIGDRLSFR
jgi:hypothetical protein